MRECIQCAQTNLCLDWRALFYENVEHWSTMPGVLPCEAEMQYLLTCKVSRYCILALHGSVGGSHDSITSIFNNPDNTSAINCRNCKARCHIRRRNFREIVFWYSHPIHALWAALITLGLCHPLWIISPHYLCCGPTLHKHWAKVWCLRAWSV